jgi:hypothetical protein
MKTKCPSTFFTAQCDKPEGHYGMHRAATQLVWGDDASDPGPDRPDVYSGKQRNPN